MGHVRASENSDLDCWRAMDAGTSCTSQNFMSMQVIPLHEGRGKSAEMLKC